MGRLAERHPYKTTHIFTIVRTIGFCILLMLAANAFSQTSLRRYTIDSKVDNECHSNVSLVLFDESAKLDKLNQLIIDRLTDHHYLFQKNIVSLKNFYGGKTFGT